MVTDIELLGPRAIVKMEHESGQVLTSVVDHDEIGKYELGTNIIISLASNALHIFPKIKEKVDPPAPKRGVEAALFAPCWSTLS